MAGLSRRLRVDVRAQSRMGKLGSSWGSTNHSNDEREVAYSRIALVEIYDLYSMLPRVLLVKATNIASHHPRFVSRKISNLTNWKTAR